MIIPKTEPLETQIAKARENLSEVSRAAIDAVIWKLIIKGINKKYTPIQLEDLEMETELLLCGLVSTVDFPRELENRMRIPKAEVNVLLSEMDKLIFKKIQEELEKRLNGEVGKEKVLYKKKEFIPDPHFINLPKDVQEAIFYSEWKEKIYDIAKKYSINIEQTGMLEEITVKTLCNIIKTEQYESEIKSKIGLPDDKNKEMVAELNEKIFKNIKDLMESNSSFEETSEQIPIPPYMAKKIEEIPIPAPVYKEPTKKESAQKEIESIISNKELSAKEADIYKESGIEIVQEVPVVQRDTLKEVVLASPPAKGEMSEGQRGSLLIKEPIEQKGSNIMLDKLLSNTTSKTTVSDYSLPKISTQEPEKPHDPYHEQI